MLKQGKFQTTMFIVGFLIAIIPIIYMLRNLFTSINPLLLAALGLGVISFAGWLYIETTTH